ncbi:MAG: hypothetical protein FWG89_03825 [Treponema sp.]|nr:hypothetical protein [Treponema sp.]
MKFKALALTIIISTTATAHIHSLGLGAQFNVNTGNVFASGAALLISPSNMTHIAINWYLGKEKTSSIGLTLDLVPLTLPLSTFTAGSVNLTLGVGIFSNVVFTDDPGINLGVRIPVGVNILLGKDMFEVFFHVAPSFGADFLPALDFTDPFYPLALGARIWFR